MRYLESPFTDAQFNLALEQVVFDRLPRSEEYFMLWQNANAIIVGRHQNTYQEVNAAFVQAHGIQVVRRLSGGGAVYHDLGNLNFTFVVDNRRSAGLDLKLFCEPVARALGRMGVRAEVTGRNDIAIGGQKFSGNAQYKKEGRVMHHGTILFDSDLGVVSQALNPSAEKLSAKGVASVRSRVGNVKPHLPAGTTLEQFKAQLVQAMFDGADMAPYAFTPGDLTAAEDLRRSRYGTWEWNYGASPAGRMCKRRRVEGCGTVEVFLTLDRGRIAGAEFLGDWFGADDAGALTGRLLGVPLERAEVVAALEGVDVGAVIAGLTAGELAGILTE